MNLKKIILLLLVICITLSTSINVFASECSNQPKNWYIKKAGRGILPKFPENLTALCEKNAYCCDYKAYSDNEKIIYLTFDAGYENGNVEKILNVLKEEDVPAAFFVLSNLVRKNTDLLKRMFEEGHLVCNHTKNHKDMTTLTPQEMQANLKTLEELTFNSTGYRMAKFFRFPEGRYSDERLELLSELGYSTIFWSVAYADWDESRQPNLSEAKRQLTEQTHPGAVILLHPTSSANAAVLKDMIGYWRSEGYKFGTLEELVAKNGEK